VESDFQFQPWELFEAPATQNGPWHALGEWTQNGAKVEAALRRAGHFLFFNPRGGDPQWNFLVATPHSGVCDPPHRAFEKLGREQTLRLLQRRALNLGLWGRFFVLTDAQNARYLLFLGASGRHLLTSWRDFQENRRREWTPFEWQTSDVAKTPSSQLFEEVEAAWQDPESHLNRVKNWHEADYFERLWQSLSFDFGDAPLLRAILRDAVGLGAPGGETTRWILRFQLPENRREGHLTLYEQLFAANEAHQWPLPPDFQRHLLELLEWVKPRRQRASEIDFVPQHEWLEGNSGVGNWSLSVESKPLSAHEKMEAALRLRANLEKFWPRDRVKTWMAPFLMGS
jgi:hypothetical protein